MLVARSLRAHSTYVTRGPMINLARFTRGTRRTLFVEAVQASEQAVLAFSQTCIPAFLPTYTTGIVVLTLLTRTILVSPFRYWAKVCKWRFEEEVKPQSVLEMRKYWGKSYLAGLRQQNMPEVRMKELFDANMHYRTAQLRKELRCSSTGPIIWTVLTQIPLFVLGTTVLQHAGYLPEVLAAAPKEMFLTLPGQEALLVPLIIGAASIANYGMGSWGMVRNMAERGGVEDPNIKDEEGKNQEGKIFDKSVESQSMLTTFSVLAVMRGVISTSLPGTVQIFWLTSTLHNIVETLFLQSVERRRMRNWGRNSHLFSMTDVQLKKAGINLRKTPPLTAAPKEVVESELGRVRAMQEGGLLGLVRWKMQEMARRPGDHSRFPSTEANGSVLNPKRNTSPRTQVKKPPLVKAPTSKASGPGSLSEPAKKSKR